MFLMGNMKVAVRQLNKIKITPWLPNFHKVSSSICNPHRRIVAAQCLPSTF